MAIATVSSLPFGACSLNELFSADTLPNIGRRSSRWQIVEAFERSQEASVMRVMPGKSGVLMMTGIPGRADTGAMYLYDEITRNFYSVDFAGADTFYGIQFDQLVLMYELEALVNMERPAQPKPFLVKKTDARADIKNVQDTPTPNPHKHNKRRNRRRKNHTGFGPRLVVSTPAVREVVTA